MSFHGSYTHPAKRSGVQLSTISESGSPNRRHADFACAESLHSPHDHIKHVHKNTYSDQTDSDQSQRKEESVLSTNKSGFRRTAPHASDEIRRRRTSSLIPFSLRHACRDGTPPGGELPDAYRSAGIRPRHAASLTLECALVLPIFLFCMIIALHYSIVSRAAAEYSSKMTSVSQQMALAAYSRKYEDADHLIRGALSQGYAYANVVNGIPDAGAVKNCSFLASSFLKDGSTIDLVLTYQADTPFSFIKVPFTVYVQRALVRGWTGRSGTAEVSDDDSGDEGTRQVYVTDHGTVYHTDPDCSHLQLTITPISAQELPSARSRSGARYRRCEYCGGTAGASGTFYIDPYGECYHTSPSCSGLTRSVNTVDLDEVGDMRECQDCAGRHADS